MHPESQDSSPAVQPDASAPSLAESNSVSGAPIDSSFKVFNAERLDWLPLPDIHTVNSGSPTMALNNNSTYGRLVDSGSSAYMNSGSSNGGDTGLSPDTGNSSSNRPTPNSTSPSETRAGHKGSAGSSYQTSPEMLHGTQPPNKETGQDRRGISTGLTPDNTFSMAETPGREFAPSGWETSGQNTTGFTPIGEGVFRQLYGLGPLDPMPMDLGWEAQPEA
jgi:hypothetical protein